MKSRNTRLFATLLLLLPYAAMLSVTSYNKVEPAWLGIPFFYWYQLLWVPLGAVLIGIANLLLHSGKQ